jgi:hypothetical protein
MDAAAAISPELALVDPGLREEARSSLPDYEWQTLLMRVRFAAHSPEARPARAGVPFWSQVGALATWMLIAFVVAGAATLALTLIADGVRLQ